jgi:hypothetical protein
MQTKSLSFLFSYNFNPNFFYFQVRILLHQLVDDFKNLVLVLVFLSLRVNPNFYFQVRILDDFKKHCLGLGFSFLVLNN